MNMDAKPYSVLHVEDDPLDAEYVQEQLVESGIPCEVTRVETREGFIQALEHTSPDLILCDYNLPGFDGLEALQIAQNHVQSAPFIFLSGGIGEHLAVECLHRGATDYVLKGNPARLIPAVKRALEEARVRRAKEQAERELAHGEKMVLLGQLSAGIAHEINNPITYINLNMETLKDYAEKLKQMYLTGLGGLLGEEPESPEEMRERWDSVRAWLKQNERRVLVMIEDLGRLAQETLDGGHRVADITQRLRRFSRQERQEAMDIDLEECLETALKIGWNEIKSKAVVQKNLVHPLPVVKGHPNQITQVLINLVVNAAQAIPGRGVIRVGIAPADGKAVITVQDSGHGIAAADLAKMFTPFFTTKSSGEGTGLGLYVSRGIIEAHGGTIRAENSPEGGALFTIELPQADKATDHGTPLTKREASG
jgi:signal transduction histidine kinase